MKYVGLMLIILPLLSAFLYSFFNIQSWVKAEPGELREFLLLITHLFAPGVGTLIYMDHK